MLMPIQGVCVATQGRSTPMAFCVFARWSDAPQCQCAKPAQYDPTSWRPNDSDFAILASPKVILTNAIECHPAVVDRNPIVWMCV